MSELALPPAEFLKYHLEPLSQHIDAEGGPHILIGCIASGGAPHVYIACNCTDNLKREMLLALSDKLRETAGKPASPILVM
jgi:hypothetical protein